MTRPSAFNTAKRNAGLFEDLPRNTGFKSAEVMYTENAQAFLKSLTDHADSVYAGRLCEWANKSLRNSESALLSLEQRIRSHPESQAEFKSTMDRIGSLRERIKADLERLRTFNIIGQDVRR